jgi:hypothetical protein
VTEVVNFGKYRGQPIEILASDRGYCDWLMAQPWFRERHQNLYTVIINHYQQPSETPEHNALQALFLDDRYREAFVLVTLGARIQEKWEQHLGERRRALIKLRKKIAEQKQALEEARQREADGHRWSFHAKPAEVAAGLAGLVAQLEKFDLPETMWMRTRSAFEKDGVDVRLEINLRSDVGETSQYSDFSNWVDDIDLTVEIKPTVGDDYPAVLRQMRNVEVLFLESYTGVGATQPQFVSMFRVSDKDVVFRHEVDAKLADLAEVAAA